MNITALVLVNALWQAPMWPVIAAVDPSIEEIPRVLAGMRGGDYPLTPLSECVEAAIATCGAGNVCGVCVTETSCSFACRDAEGKCDHWDSDCGADHAD